MMGLAALIGVFRLDKLIILFSRLREARRTVYGLHDTVTDLDRRIDDVNESIGSIIRLGLGERLDAMTRSIDSGAKDIGTSIETLKGFGKRLDRQERQALMVHSRPDRRTRIGSIARGWRPPNVSWTSETPWERLTDVWDEATLRLEYLIDERLEGKHGNTVLKYNRLSRQNYRPIIEMPAKTASSMRTPPPHWPRSTGCF